MLPEPVGVVAEPGRVGALEDEEPRELAADALRRSASISSSAMIGRSARLPLGSPTMPVPPPTRAIGRVAGPLEPGQAHRPGPGCRRGGESAVGSKPT